MAEISIAKAKAEFAALVARAESGEQIVVTRNGRPVACIGPLPKFEPVVFGDLRGVWIADDLQLPADLLDDVIEDFERGV